MSTIIKYKDNTLATVENETKTIKTANKWLEDNITLEKTDSENPAVYQDEDGYIVLDDDGNRVSVQSLIAHTNETYVAPTGFAYNKVSVRVPISDITKSIINKSVTNVNASDFPNATSISESLFQECNSLESVSMPSATLVNTHAFHSCTALTSVNLPKVTDISVYAFTNCTALKTVYAPKAKSFASYAFDGCTNLETLILPSKTNFAFQTYCFRNCTKLSSFDFSECTIVGNQTSMFQNTALTGIYAPKATSFCAFTNSAFADCTQLVYARAPKSAGVMREKSFMNCTALKLVDLGVMTNFSIGNNFNGCTALEVMILRKADAITTLGNVNNFTDVGLTQPLKIYCPSALISTYETASNWATLVANNQVEFLALEDSPYEDTEFEYMGVPQ